MSIRLKSVTNIAKITKSMKMVSAAKYQIADRELKPARVFGVGAQGNEVGNVDMYLFVGTMVYSSLR